MDKAKIKSDNMKMLPKFLMVLLVAGLCGGVIGFLMCFLEDKTDVAEFVVQSLNRGLGACAFWGIPISTVLMSGAVFYLYSCASRIFAGWDGEDEEIMEKADNLLSWALFVGSTQMILDMFLFAAGVYYIDSVKMLIAVGFFLVSIALVIVQQQKIIDLLRQMNPEKKGSIYDTKFKEKWLESCDEAEQKQIGQAAFQTHCVMSVMYPVVWAVLVMLSICFDLGIAPIFFVTLLWGVQNGTYCIAAIRMNKKHSA